MEAASLIHASFLTLPHRYISLPVRVYGSLRALRRHPAILLHRDQRLPPVPLLLQRSIRAAGERGERRRGRAPQRGLGAGGTCCCTCAAVVRVLLLCVCCCCTCAAVVRVLLCVCCCCTCAAAVLTASDILLILSL